MHRVRVALHCLAALLALIVVGHLDVHAQHSHVENAVSAVRFDTDMALSVDELVKLGLERNGEVRAMRDELDAAKGRARQAGLLPNPMLEFKQTRSRDGMDSNVMFEGSMPIEITGRRGARIEAARRELELKEIAVQSRERDLAVEIRKAYSALAGARAKVVLHQQALEFAEEAHRITQGSVKAGKLAPLDQSMELVELNKLRAMHERLLGDVETAAFALKNLIGMKPDDALAVSTTLDVNPAVMLSQENAIAVGLQQRPEIRGAKIVEALAAARVRLARAEGRPDVELSAGIERSRASFPFNALDRAGMLGPIEKEMKMFSFGLKISLPILNSNQGEIGAMKAEESAARERRVFGEVSVRADIASMRAQFERAFRASEIMRVGVLEMSRRNLAVLRGTYELGGLSLTEFLSGQRSALDTEVEFVEARRMAFDAQTDYLRAIGSESVVGR